MNVKTEQKISASHRLRKDTSGIVILNAPAIPPLNPYWESISVTKQTGIVLQCDPSAKKPGIISNAANKAFIQNLIKYNCSLTHALSPLSYERASKSQLKERRINSDD